jgi:hypothetical protein
MLGTAIPVTADAGLNLDNKVRFVAFPATEYDEVLSGYQLGQMVER